MKKEGVAMLLQSDLAQSRIFWDRYEWRLEDDFSYECLKDQPIRMDVTDHIALLLDPGDDFCYVSLALQERNNEDIEIAWDDQAHFHPFVLRFEEWKLISAHLAQKYETEIWIPSLLLRRFVGVESCTNYDSVFAWELHMRRISGLFTEEELQCWPRQKEFEDPKFWESYDRKWVHKEPYGWVFEGSTAYSLRQSKSPSFPFEAWNTMMNAIKEL
jgi:hypothetical protein